jgi:hypothetical protein
VLYALSIGDRVLCERRTLSGHPEVVTARIAKTGLDIVRNELRSR